MVIGNNDYTTAACFYEDTYERQGSLMGHRHNLSPASAYWVERNNQLIFLGKPCLLICRGVSRKQLLLTLLAAKGDFL